MAKLSDVRAVSPLADGRSYDACYYQRSFHRPYRRDQEWLDFFDKIAARIADEIQPWRVLDAGCGLGLLVETMRLHGIDASGIDLSEYAIDCVHESMKPFCQRASAAEPFGERYDLIVSIEVLEHMLPADADDAIANFCAHTDDVLFSSTPFDFGEVTHANVRPPEYWAAQFARHGFYRDVDFDASFITSWAVRFRRRAESISRLSSDYERALSRLAIERNQLRNKLLSMQAEMSGLFGTQEHLLQQLAESVDTIEHMERSWFWRARKPWAWIRRLLAAST